jgi:hypothetical protein
VTAADVPVPVIGLADRLLARPAEKLDLANRAERLRVDLHTGVDELEAKPWIAADEPDTVELTPDDAGCIAGL